MIGLTADSFSAFSYLGAFLLPLGLLLLATTTSKFLVRMDMRRNAFALAVFGQIFFTLSEEIAGVWLQVAIYNMSLIALGFFVARQATKLVDLRYLRPRRVPLSWTDEEPVSSAPS